MNKNDKDEKKQTSGWTDTNMSQVNVEQQLNKADYINNDVPVEMLYEQGLDYSSKEHVKQNYMDINLNDVISQDKSNVEFRVSHNDLNNF